MGYFSNGTEGGMYEEEWCDWCVHYEGCAVLHAHAIFNYDDCNKSESILHILIPRDGIHNEKCKMFVEQKELK